MKGRESHDTLKVEGQGMFLIDYVNRSGKRKLIKLLYMVYLTCIHKPGKAGEAVNFLFNGKPFQDHLSHSPISERKLKKIKINGQMISF